MWIHLKQYIKQKEEAGRPDFFLKYDIAKEQHLNPFLLKFKLRMKDEQEVMESVWKEPKTLIDLRKHLRYILRLENMEKEDFVENLILVKDQLDRQNFYFDQVKDLLFCEEKSTFDKIHDEDLAIELESEDRYEQAVVDEMVVQRNREAFLQKEIGQVLLQKNMEPTSDSKIEYAKQCYQHCSLSMPLMINPAELVHGQFVIIGNSVDEGQAKSLAAAMPAIPQKFKQLCFSNNNMNGKSLAHILQGLSPDQKYNIKSIIYSGQSNELNKESGDALRLQYLDKKGSGAL